jgi:ribonucleoside-diphosphate reductase alpha chain
MSLETQTTSGGEPLLYFSQKRRKKGNLTDDNFRCDFVDKNGDKWMEFEFIHPKVALWKNITGKLDIKESPWYGCLAEDLNYKLRIKMQATIQKHIDHSISSTINLPENTNIETIKEIYELAWKKGLKGVTVYRDGCRDGVLLDNSKKQDIIDKRPKELPCDVYHVAVNTKSYFVLVGLLDDLPYEIFAGRNGLIKNSIKTGKVIRKKKGFYKAIFEDDTEISPITATSTDIEETITRLVSTSLRAKVDLNLVVTQLEKVGGENAEMHSFAKVLARVLKKYIKDGVKIEGEVCPECGGQLVRKEGCWSCEKCCYQKCG